MTIPDRHPDIKFEVRCKHHDDRLDSIVSYWVEEGIRMIETEEYPEYKEIQTGIDAEKMYRSYKGVDLDLVLYGSAIKLFLEGYENYLIERDLLHD